MFLSSFCGFSYFLKSQIRRMMNVAQSDKITGSKSYFQKQDLHFLFGLLGGSMGGSTESGMIRYFILNFFFIFTLRCPNVFMGTYMHELHLN